MLERLQKLIARAGVASRREAETLITEGKVTVNGELITELGHKADPEKDHIKVAGKLIKIDEAFTYILLNKPKGVISSVHDPEGRITVTAIMKDIQARIYPVGRLDFNTEGALLLTNDGNLTHQLLAPKSKCPKTYMVKVAGNPERKTILRLQRGITVDGTRFGACKIEPLKSGSNTWLRVVLFEGKNHQIKKMFETVGHPVSKLRRIAFAFLTTKGLKPGEWRNLNSVEVDRLKRGDYEFLTPLNPFKFLREVGVGLRASDYEAYRKEKGEAPLKKPGLAKRRGQKGSRPRNFERRDDERAPRGARSSQDRWQSDSGGPSRDRGRDEGYRDRGGPRRDERSSDRGGQRSGEGRPGSGSTYRERGREEGYRDRGGPRRDERSSDRGRSRSGEGRPGSGSTYRERGGEEGYRDRGGPRRDERSSDRGRPRSGEGRPGSGSTYRERGREEGYRDRGGPRRDERSSDRGRPRSGEGRSGSGSNYRERGGEEGYRDRRGPRRDEGGPKRSGSRPPGQGSESSYADRREEDYRDRRGPKSRVHSPLGKGRSRGGPDSSRDRNESSDQARNPRQGSQKSGSSSPKPARFKAKRPQKAWSKSFDRSGKKGPSKK